MVIDSNFFMNLALQEAWKYQGFTYPNPAVGCCVVGDRGELLSINAHKKAGTPHAEIMALQDAYCKLTSNTDILSLTSSSEIHAYLLQNHNNCFKNVSLYATLEPCSHQGKTPSCASLISQLGIKKVYVGVSDFNEVAAHGNDILRKNGVDVAENILQKECSNLLEPFSLWSKEKFIFFKWAQRLNGTTDGGIISSKESRRKTHAMRDLCDLLVIGGNTVRIDRPTLDSRLVNGKAPDILILSKEKTFDKTIPLFNVKNRRVFIADNFSLLDSYNNIMIEGGAAMFALSKVYVDYYLSFVAPSFGGSKGFKNLDTKFEILNLQKEEQDIMMWMKETNNL